MPGFTLTDVASDLWVESFSIDAAGLGLPAPPAWSVAKRVLRGGRRDGVDLVRLDNGALSVSIVPTRGMGLWRADYRGDRLGWDSPVADGPVHPAHVNLATHGGLGWLDGFDELLARCGLESNGAPYEETSTGPDGSERHTTFGLHGRIANRPAHRLAVSIGDDPPHEIAVEGQVDEARPFGPHLRMTTRISTTPGSNRLVVRDEFANLGDGPGALQVLYHWNFGPPFLAEGARLLAAAEAVAPRDARAGEGIARYDVYGGPEPGFAEQVYFFRLRGAGPEGRTVALLRHPAGTRGVALRFATAQLPAFTLWKNTGGRCGGYVTGLEPATNYPNPRPFEAARGRVVALPPGGTHAAEMTLEVLDSADAVAAIEAEIRDLRAGRAPTVHERPTEPFGPEAPAR